MGEGENRPGSWIPRSDGGRRGGGGRSASGRSSWKSQSATHALPLECCLYRWPLCPGGGCSGLLGAPDYFSFSAKHPSRCVQAVPSSITGHAQLWWQPPMKTQKPSESPPNCTWARSHRAPLLRDAADEPCLATSPSTGPPPPPCAQRAKNGAIAAHL